MGRKLTDQYALVPHWFVRQAVPVYSLGAAEVLTYVVLCDHADEKRMTWISQRNLVIQSGLSRSSVQNSLARLSDIGLIEQVGEPTSHRATRWHLPTTMPLPAKVVALPSRRARMEGASWVGIDDDDDATESVPDTRMPATPPHSDIIRR